GLRRSSGFGCETLRQHPSKERGKMLSEAQIQEFHQRGFVHGGPVITEAQADTMRERLFAVMEGRADGKAEAVRDFHDGKQSSVVQIVNIWEADDLFHRHLYNPQICEMVLQLMGTDTLRVWHDQVQYKPPHIGGPTDWHQDHPYWPIIQ